mmetsp:Transcript_27298/g.63379  ORF Transcript_27298/g.63379 Transcript_27298/m.63379 type:complete len:209 (+) Transcript_27298:833-1459(+)
MLGSANHQEPNHPCAGRVPPDPRYHSFTLTMWDRRIFAFPRIMVREPCLLFLFFLWFMPVLANDAQIICDNSGVISLLPWIFAAVKSAFGRNYECMGITCDAVGGYWRVLYRCCSLLRSAPGRYILLEYVPASSVTDHVSFVSKTVQKRMLLLRRHDSSAHSLELLYRMPLTWTKKPWKHNWQTKRIPPLQLPRTFTSWEPTISRMPS